MDKLGVFHANIYVSRSTSELRVRLVRRETGLSPPVIFYLPFQGGTSLRYYPPTKSEGYSFGVVHLSVHPHFLSVPNHISVHISQI